MRFTDADTRRTGTPQVAEVSPVHVDGACASSDPSASRLPRPATGSLTPQVPSRAVNQTYRRAANPACILGHNINPYVFQFSIISIIYAMLCHGQPPKSLSISVSTARSSEPRNVGRGAKDSIIYLLVDNSFNPFTSPTSIKQYHISPAAIEKSSRKTTIISLARVGLECEIWLFVT